MVQRRHRAGLSSGLPYVFVFLACATRERRACALALAESRGLAPPSSRSPAVFSAARRCACCFCAPVGDVCCGRGRRSDRIGGGISGTAQGPTGRWGERELAVGWRHSGNGRHSRQQVLVESTSRRRRRCSTTKAAAAATGAAGMAAAGRASQSSRKSSRSTDSGRSSCRETGIFGGWATRAVERSAMGRLGCSRRDEGRDACPGGEFEVGGMKGGRRAAISAWDRRRSRCPVKLAKLSAGRSDGDMDGSCVAEGSQGVNGSLGNTSAAVEDGEDSGETCGKENAAEEMRPQDPSGMARKFWAALTSVCTSASKLKLPRLPQPWDDLDEAYAMMPDIQAELREKTGWEGTGAGYEDVRLGFYRDTNLKPMNWKDAMVSMKPGSGTAGLDPEFDDNAGSPAEVERRRRRRAKAGARERASDDGGKETVGTRYGGPPPGTHGPWRWRQLVKGSALEKKLKVEIASFPRRLPRKVRRYYDDKVVWITGADHGVGEQLAINLTVNGARVILSGTDFDELERVQRLCILAWMKAIDWELMNAILYGWTRLDRAMILPLDVRDEFFLQRAHEEAVSMLDRPMDMVFHCQDEGVRGTGAAAVGQEEEEEEEEGEELDPANLDSDLEGAVALTKVLVPGMLDTGEGRIVVFSGGDASPRAPEGRPSPTGVVSSKQAPGDFFESLRAEVAQDGVKVTLVHHKGNLGQHGGGDTATKASHPRTSARARRASVAARVAARKVLTSVSRGKKEVFLYRRGVLGAAARLGARARGAVE